MATKTFRTISINSDLDKRLLKLAQREKQSASMLVRTAVEQQLFQNKRMGCQNLKMDTVSAG